MEAGVGRTWIRSPVSAWSTNGLATLWDWAWATATVATTANVQALKLGTDILNDFFTVPILRITKTYHIAFVFIIREKTTTTCHPQYKRLVLSASAARFDRVLHETEASLFQCTKI